MIYIKAIRDVKYDDYDEVWAIVRSWKTPNNPHVKHVPELSPSPKLFGMFQEAKKKETWGEVYFNTIYVPIFLTDVKKDNKAKNALNRLVKADREGKNICLVCYCTDEHICHRSIVAGLLQGIGCNVDVGDNYSKYYDQYARIDCPFRHKNGNCLPHGGFCTSVSLKDCIDIQKHNGGMK